ncbi:hypothetical protein LTR85_003263 [Meristemomyces frigidus]|nr:hypothetical protein LTR85_003263 [Meristemomyces frigidus]
MAQTDGGSVITSASPTSTISSTGSSITPTSISGASASTSSDIPLSLWAIADSLLSTYYPSTSTTLTQVASLTWPTAVVIGGTTYSVHSGTTGGVVGSPTTSVLAEATNNSSGNSSPHHDLTSDKKLGIVIGVVVGSVAFAVLALVFCCLWRRKKATGRYFLRRPTPSITDSDLDTWRSPMQQETSTLSSGPSREWTDKYNRMSTQERLAPPMAMHPAYLRQYSSQSTSEENPFFTPQESPDHHEMEGDQMHHNELDASEGPSQRRSSSSFRRLSRPPTPFSPMAMMGLSSAPQQQNHNPFTSPEDEEADDVISPIIPSRSPERRHSPMVHYPSWSEVSEFDFTGSNEGRGRASLRGQSSSEEGGDGWHPARRESVIGRHELA